MAIVAIITTWRNWACSGTTLQLIYDDDNDGDVDANDDKDDGDNGNTYPSPRGKKNKPETQVCYLFQPRGHCVLLM